MIGNKIKFIRIYRQMTQTDLAKLTGVIRQTIAAIESGTVTPQPEFLNKIESALGVETSAVDRVFEYLDSNKA